MPQGGGKREKAKTGVRESPEETDARCPSGPIRHATDGLSQSLINNRQEDVSPDHLSTHGFLQKILFQRAVMSSHLILDTVRTVWND